MPKYQLELQKQFPYGFARSEISKFRPVWQRTCIAVACWPGLHTLRRRPPVNPTAAAPVILYSAQRACLDADDGHGQRTLDWDHKYHSTPTPSRNSGAFNFKSKMKRKPRTIFEG
ncbi:unnamed protein product [Ceratitis capitata]|uniref:(Mediterranean fruit fly) hypothetical protein n=1 Tax=Ceratitis capitata TaxID=7213 RepID=A0A811U1Z3_CERCA|nr:unnamed protein product [Ceratitis capitata]